MFTKFQMPLIAARTTFGLIKYSVYRVVNSYFDDNFHMTIEGIGPVGAKLIGEALQTSVCTSMTKVLAKGHA